MFIVAEDVKGETEKDRVASPIFSGQFLNNIAECMLLQSMLLSHTQ